MKVLDKIITLNSDIKYDGIKGIPVMCEPASSLQRNTGTWRVFKPIIDTEKCVKCLRCWVFCPEGAIHVKDELWIDYEHCKGCGICVNLCKFITESRE
ncbi:MAG TPA: 4Fe-4S dicluster domain-containing protein [Methanosarcinales archaeon]|nr:4Fe-4S dicluster domain-containing protein [Methanosarcinales archaeon]